MQLFNLMMGIASFVFLFAGVNIWMSYYVYLDVVKKNRAFKLRPFKYNCFAVLKLKYYPLVSWVYFYANLALVASTLASIVFSILQFLNVIPLMYLTIVGAVWFLMLMTNAIWIMKNINRI
jgi:hypothetical protein